MKADGEKTRHMQLFIEMQQIATKMFY